MDPIENFVDKLIGDFDRQLEVLNYRNRGYPLELKSLTFTISLYNPRYEMSYSDEHTFGMKDPQYSNAFEMIDLKKSKPFKRLLRHANKAGYKFKCVREAATYLYLEFGKSSWMYRFAVLVDRYIL
jgi:hypothetical protein